MNIPTLRSAQPTVSSNHTGISRRAAIGRMGMLGGAFLACNFLGDAFAQSMSNEGAIADMRKMMAAIPPVTTKLGDGIYMIAGPGGNIGAFTWSEGKLAIDSGVSGASDAILAQFDALGAQPLRTLINTHWHYDHTEGNQAFRKHGAQIMAHENVPKRMRTAQDIDFFHAHIPPSPVDALPEKLFSSESKLSLGGEEIRITHVASAHTDGDSFIQFAHADVIHTGDIGFSGSYPFIDYSTGGSVGGMIKGADKILSVCDSKTKIIPGHGPVMTKAELMQYRDMLADVAERVRVLKKQGGDVAAVVAAKPSAKYDESHKGFFTPDQFVTIVYSSL